MAATKILTGVLALASLTTSSLAHDGHDNATSFPYTLVADYSESNFFDGFVTFTGPDPTHGKVNYTDMAFAANQGYLAYTYHEQDNTTRARIGVDNVSQASGAGRNSVRLTSRATFNAGTLLVADINHIPVGPSLWPALWLLGTGAQWPAAGEIDILEYVHDTPFNAMTLHTSPGCSVANSSTTNPFAGTLQSADCNAGAGSTGCGIHAPATTFTSLNASFASAGHAFNSQGGAVYVTEWTSLGIKIWAFSRSSVPASLNSEFPSTADFPAPLAAFGGQGCDFAKAFKDMVLIINTDFCGDWAGKVWKEAGAEEATGVGSCDDYVAQNPEKFEEAFWEISSIKVYASEVMPGRNPDLGREGFGG